MRSRLTRVIALGAALFCVSCSKKTATPDPPVDAPASVKIVFKDAAGRELSERDLDGASGKVNWEVVGGAAVPDAARQLHEAGRAAGGKGEYDSALDLFNQASKLAPAWPYPLYEAAFTYLQKHDNARAEAYYEKVEALAPRGFFTAKTSLYCLRRERLGTVGPGFCFAFERLEWLDDAAKKRGLLQGIVEKYPDFAPAWKELANLLEDQDTRLQAITSGLAHDADGETKGMLLINKAAILDNRGDHAGAVRILGELATDPQSTLGTETIAKFTLSKLVAR
jgi:tetratricopeptide (TPR) repeat protein